jgi:hypothetical protein
MNNPKFGAGILSDLARIQPTGKIDTFGAFTQFNAWGYPCNRTWFLTFSVFNLSQHQTIIISLKKTHTKGYKTLATIDAENKNGKTNQIFHLPLSFSFESNGNYEIVCSFKESSNSLRIPFIVETIKWPEFSNEELEAIGKLRETIPYKVNVNFNCIKCSHVYVFEESVFNEEDPSGGTIRFPENGRFECENCGNILQLKDLQGRVRSSLKGNILSLIKR